MNHFVIEEKENQYNITPIKEGIELDVNVISELRNIFVKGKINNRKKIYFYLKKVHYIDSSGLGFLLNLVKDLKMKVYLFDVSDDIMEVLKATRVTPFFKFETSKGRK